MLRSLTVQHIDRNNRLLRWQFPTFEHVLILTQSKMADLHGITLLYKTILLDEFP